LTQLNQTHNLVDRIIVNIRIDATGGAIAALVTFDDILPAFLFNPADEIRITSFLREKNIKASHTVFYSPDPDKPKN
jgi:hypothetical protein